MDKLIQVVQELYKAIMPRKYTWINAQIKFPNVDIPKGGSAYLFDNSNGSVDVQINNYNLGVGRSLSLGGDQNELDTTAYKITYPSNSGAIDLWYKKYN